MTFKTHNTTGCQSRSLFIPVSPGHDCPGQSRSFFFPVSPGHVYPDIPGPGVRYTGTGNITFLPSPGPCPGPGPGPGKFGLFPVPV